MHGVRLVSTPATNKRGIATSGRPERVCAMFEKSIESLKLFSGKVARNERRAQYGRTLQSARFLLGFCRTGYTKQNDAGATDGSCSFCGTHSIRLFCAGCL